MPLTVHTKKSCSFVADNTRNKEFIRPINLSNIVRGFIFENIEDRFSYSFRLLPVSVNPYFRFEKSTLRLLPIRNLPDRLNFLKIYDSR